MADTVRYMMEDMVPELEEFVKQHYFSRPEVKQIVKRRQEFEYLLKRPAALKEDYLRYIEYESNLEALWRHRREALLLAQNEGARLAEKQGGKQQQQKKKASLANHAIVRRIHFIYERALRKFKTDVALWTAWLEFCRSSNSNRRLGRVVGRALQIHPTEPGLWVYAAAWELEANSNPAAARALMQQGLRMCRHSEKMWLDYFDMELMYVEKLVARRRILGLDVPQPDTPAAAATVGKKRPRDAAGDAAGDADQQQQQGDDAAESDGEGPETEQEAAAPAGAGADGQQPLSTLLAAQGGSEQQQPDPLLDGHAAMNAVLTGAVARLVFQQAIKAAAAAAGRGVSSSNYLKPTPAPSMSSSGGGGLGFRARFLEVLSRYSAPGVPQLRQEVLASIRQDFGQEPAAADLLARAACDPSDAAASPEAVQAAVQEYEQLLGGSTTAAAAAESKGGSKGRASKRQKAAAAAVSSSSTAPQLSHEAVVQLYRLYCSYLQQRLQVLLADAGQALAAAGVAQQVFKLLLAAHDAAAADEAMYLQWVQLAVQLKQRKVALKAARLATEALPSSVPAWHTRLQLEEQAAVSNKKHSKAEGHAAETQQQQPEQQLFALLVQALQQVPAGDAEQLWQQGFDMATSGAAAAEGEGSSGSSKQLSTLQQMLVAAVTRACVKGPACGGLGAVAGSCLTATWRLQGPAAARQLWQRLLLLPPAGGGMFRAMVTLEAQQDGGPTTAGGGGSDQQQLLLPADAVKRVRAVYEAWAGAYGGSDAALWVEYAAFEQRQSKAGAGKVYWRAVKALTQPDAFIAAYRQRVGLED